jgi:hypothetical protein
LIFLFASTFRKQIWELMWLVGRLWYRMNAQDLTYLELTLLKYLAQWPCLGELYFYVAYPSSG